MLYKAKEGSNTYNYIKSVCEDEEVEKKAYFERVEDTVGFKFKSFSGYLPNNNLRREYRITALLVDDETWNNIDKKLWKRESVIRGLNRIIPIKRTKKGKEIAEVFNSYKPVTSHFELFKKLNVKEPDKYNFSITQLIYNKDKGVYIIYFDDDVRADKDNNDLIEITMSEYDELMK